MFTKLRSLLFGYCPETSPTVRDGHPDFEMISLYSRNKDHDKALQLIGGQTIDDLNLEEVFVALDRTHSRIGQQYLFDRLLTIDTSANFAEQERWIESFTRQDDLRRKLQQILSKLNKREAYYLPQLFQNNYIRKPGWFWVIRLMSALSVGLVAGVIIGLPLVLPLVLSLTVNLLFHYWNKGNMFMYTYSIAQLLVLYKCVDRLSRTCIPPADDQAAVTASIRSIEKLKGRLAIFNMEAQLDTDAAAIVYAITEYIKIAFLIEPLVVFNVLEKLGKKRDDIQRLYEYVGRVDTALSVAALREEVPYHCRPTFSDQQAELDFTDVYHPLIPDCVPNSLRVDRRSILLTGSNMSGKSSFIRTIAINCLTAQTINTCFARRFRLSPLRLFSAIRISDDLLNDKSYYFEEVLTIKRMLNECREDTATNLFLLDEIFKGTNTIERIAAGKAVLSYLGQFARNIVFVSTHDIELADLLRDEYELYYFTEIIKDEQIHFDYILKLGQLSTRNAIRILELNDYPEEVIREAKQLAEGTVSL